MTEQSESTPTLQAPTAGSLLARERERQNLSIAEVAARLRLASRQVEALEADAYEKIPGPTFARGFLRNYARLLQLDAAAVIAAYDARIADQAAARRINVPHESIQFTDQRRRRSNRVLIATAAAIVLVTVIGIVIWQWQGEPSGWLPGLTGSALKQPSAQSPNLARSTAKPAKATPAQQAPPVLPTAAEPAAELAEQALAPNSRSRARKPHLRKRSNRCRKRTASTLLSSKSHGWKFAINKAK